MALKTDKILTKSNLVKRDWYGDTTCPLCGDYETVNHLFVVCPFTNAIWSWITGHNGFSFDCEAINDLWFIDACILLKDTLLIELLRAAAL